MLDLTFDTGANMGVLTEEGQKKGAVLAAGNKNTFELGGVSVENSPAVFVDFHGVSKSDGVVGYNAFEGKAVEINYNKTYWYCMAALAAATIKQAWYGRARTFL